MKKFYIIIIILFSIIAASYVLFRGPAIRSSLLINERIFIPFPERTIYNFDDGGGFPADAFSYNILKYSEEDITKLLKKEEYQNYNEAEINKITQVLESYGWPYNSRGEIHLTGKGDLDNHPIILSEDSSVLYRYETLESNKAVISKFILISIDPTSNLVYIIKASI